MKLFDSDNMKELFSILEECKYTDQNPEFHPEGNVLNHSIQCFHWACRESNDIDLILAALLHDVGKSVMSKGHEVISGELIHDYVSVKTLFLVENHMRTWSYIEGQTKKLSKVRYLTSHPWFPELIHLLRYDRLGRQPNKKNEFDKDKIITILNKKVYAHFGLPKCRQLSTLGEHKND